MAIPTRQQWQKLRDGAGGKAGMVKGIKVGDLLDQYHKAATGLKGLDGYVNLVRPLHQLSQGMKKYRAQLPANQTKLIKVVDSIHAEIDTKVKVGQRLANPAHNAMQNINDVFKELKAAWGTKDNVALLKAYKNLYEKSLPAARKAFHELSRVDPGLSGMLKEWDVLFTKLAAPAFSPDGIVKKANNDNLTLKRSLEGALKVWQTEITRSLGQLRQLQVTGN
jgi:hypothetical protein